MAVDHGMARFFTGAGDRYGLCKGMDMKVIEVLGSGCSKCQKTADSIGAIAGELKVEVDLRKETSPQALLTYGVMSTPAVVIDGVVVHSGSIPHRVDIEQWLRG